MNNETNWIHWYYIATYLLALVAIAGFWASIRSSRQATQAAHRVQIALGAMVEPIVKVKEYAWAAPTLPISCNNLPQQVIIGIRNFSSVPAQLHRTDFRTFFGEKELTDLAQNEQVGNDRTVILAPGEILSLNQVQPTEFPQHLKMLTGYPLMGPQFTIRIEAEYSRVGSRRRWLYRTKQVLVFDCKNPTAGGRRALEESVEPISDMSGTDATTLSSRTLSRLARWATDRAKARSATD